MIDDRETLDMEGLLRFYAEAGVDMPLSDTPIDRFAEAQRQPVRSAPAQQENKSTSSADRSRAQQQQPRQAATPLPTSRPVQAASDVPDNAQIALAREAALQAATLDELREKLAAFDGCNLKFTAKNLCFADGDPSSDIMFVGEAPGRDEDMEGLPFVGKSGQLLNRMIEAIGLKREGVYIANTIPWRPPGNRTPTPVETELCRPFIERQIELAAPKVLVALGGPAGKALTGATEGILRLRGNWKVHRTPSGIEIPVMPTLHPAYLLRTPAQKRFAWRDFLAVKMKLAELAE
ncbi:uracil-DNA glycosylase [Brucella pseudogrignonensis]|uniref:uracil-DNA glycosylase n=1 Tax=Brucella pseudogrignonensis TaxID=419475 RepID=UPI000CFD00D9|nr:uracil-DNA glycosylase [Brucella pseudogrignonensis]MQP41888.1 uracil-DNA glycosylase [Ochrobactrum sp. MYb237]PQZ42949.1 uracil-DNA glycosylase [Brucella pseudogrignonensis]PRA38102.1 uracil-DNA glycosylase [Brucella pseudogrignonensis]PRA63588.1 uracil-DNA glycosylase [Brucella pseudogrignonensis]